MSSPLAAMITKQGLVPGRGPRPLSPCNARNARLWAVRLLGQLALERRGALFSEFEDVSEELFLVLGDPANG